MQAGQGLTLEINSQLRCTRLRVYPILHPIKYTKEYTVNNSLKLVKQIVQLNRLIQSLIIVVIIFPLIKSV